MELLAVLTFGGFLALLAYLPKGKMDMVWLCMIGGMLVLTVIAMLSRALQ